MSAHEIFASKDPRLGSKLLPQFFPLSDLGEPPPVDTPNRNGRIRLEFLTTYYKLNVLFARLLATGDARPSRERARIESEIQQLRKVRDQLEDRYAPYGVIAEATFVKGFAVNVSFTFPDESRWFREQRSTMAWEAELRFELASQAGDHR
jgi:hypothetical protein